MGVAVQVVIRAQVPAAELAAWLELRFPEGGTLEHRDQRSRRRRCVMLALSGAAVVALAALLVVSGLPDVRDPTPFPWPLVALLVSAVLWAALAAALMVATWNRPPVSSAERDVLAARARLALRTRPAAAR